MSNDKIIAIGFLTRDDLDVLGQGFRRHFKIDDPGDFADLIEKLDQLYPGHELVDRTEIDMQRRGDANANPLAPPINNRGGS